MKDTLDPFTLAYIEAALWSSTDESTPQGGEPLDKNYGRNDIDSAALARMKEDCAKFQDQHGALIREAAATGEVVTGPDCLYNESARAGHDFWLTRNGHGDGFWDGDWPEPFAQQLTDAAEAFGSCDLYVGDDGQLHIS